MPLVLNMPGFWLYQGSGYARVTKGSKYAWIIPEYALICLIVSWYVWIFLNMPQYPWIRLNLLYVFSNWTHGYLFERLQETRGYSLEVIVCFLEETKFDFFYSSISFVFFCFRLNILQVRFKFAVTFWGVGGELGPVNLDIPF